MPNDTTQQPVTDPDRLFYVTVKDAGRTGWLAGPFETHQEALDRVDSAKKRAIAANPWADFYAYGTASLPRTNPQPKVVFQLLEEVS